MGNNKPVGVRNMEMVDHFAKVSEIGCEADEELEMEASH